MPTSTEFQYIDLSGGESFLRLWPLEDQIAVEFAVAERIQGFESHIEDEITRYNGEPVDA